MTNSKKPTFVATGFDSVITSIAVMLVAQRDGEYHCLGSGVIVAPGIGITARHVFEGFEQVFNDPRSHSEKTFSLDAIQIVEGRSPRRWSIRKVHMHEDATDLAFLHLLPTTKEQLAQPALTLSIKATPPAIGDNIQAFGYHSSSFAPEEDKLVLRTNPFTSTGVITAHHLRGRDKRMLPFPCVETNARFDPAMSGGPVFHDGALVGIITSSLPPGIDDPTGEHTSYVSLIWPILGMPVAYDRPNRTGQTYLAYELAKEGYLHVTDFDRLSLVGTFLELHIK